jgi:uncharacterized membrane protein YsdA (DUF1294 family)
MAATAHPLRLVDLLGLGMLWIAPTLALHRLSRTTDPWFLLGWCAAVSVITFFAYQRDKSAAQGGRPRTPESTLHLLSAAGGWTGALLARRIFRHKTAKPSFQFTFWAIVAVHQYVALDYTLRWRFARALWRALP